MSILKVGMYASQFPTRQNYLTFSSDESFSIKFNQQSWDGVLEYSLDTQNWYEWDASEINSSGNTLYLRGSGNSYITGEPAISNQVYAMQISATDGVECSGNIMTLLDYGDVDNAVMGNGAFASLFYGQDKLITSPELPATVLAHSCYRNMFRDTGIEVAPELPATVLAPYCYFAMLRGTDIAVSPELPATALAHSCYYAMFYGCISLTAAPELPATVLAPYCYRDMFIDTGIDVAPELPATVLAHSCYQFMFSRASIRISETQTGTYQTPWRIPSVGTITSEPVDWSSDMLANTSGTFTGNPAINTTYYQAN